MTDNILTVVLTVLSSGFVGFAIKQWMSHQFKKKLEILKDDFTRRNQTIKNEFEKEQISIKSDLAKIEHEHNIRFAQTYTIKAEMIRELYQKLVSAEKSLCIFLKPIKLRVVDQPSHDDLAKQTWQAFDDFKLFFLKNEIVLDESICKIIHAINDEFAERWGDYNMERFRKGTGLEPSSNIEKQFENYDKSFNEVIPKLKKELKKAFHKELGITKHPFN